MKYKTQNKYEKSFVVVRLDRMKNMDLTGLCNDIINTFDLIDEKKPKLEVISERFRKIKPLFKNLDPKYRKIPQTKKIVELRKRQDNLICALLLHVKALKRADFPEIHTEIMMTENYLRKHFNNFIHLNIIKKSTYTYISIRNT